MDSFISIPSKKININIVTIMNKIKNISLLCACALLSAGSAVADPGPILSPDGTSFQLNFPSVIMDKLNEFIAGVEGQERYEPFGHKVVTLNGLSLCEAIHKDFWTTIQATAPYINIPPKKRADRLSAKNLVSMAKTLLWLNAAHIAVPINFALYIQMALDYFQNQPEGIQYYSPTPSCGRYPRRRQKTAEEKSEEEYKCALDEIITRSLSE
jgi:hypothetical protein